MSSPDSDPELQERRAAVADLGQALRDLGEAAVSSEVDAATLREVAERGRELTAALDAATRDRHEMPSVDDLAAGFRMHNPACGQGNPVAPPMEVGDSDGVAVGTCTLGLRYEGPPSYAHGGVSAMLLDQILGHAHAISGRPGMTVRLSLRYRAPVPLRTPLRVSGWVERETGEHSTAKAALATADAPDAPLVEAEGKFVTPDPDQVRRLFSQMRTADHGF